MHYKWARRLFLWPVETDEERKKKKSTEGCMRLWRWGFSSFHPKALLRTTNVFLKCLAMHALLAYSIPAYLCLRTPPALCVCISYTSSVLNHSFFASGKLRHRCAQLHWKGDSNPSRHYLPLIRGPEWLDKQAPFPNCVWRGNCARRAAAGSVAGAKRVHFVQHTRRIWRADVLSAAIQLQT